MPRSATFWLLPLTLLLPVATPVSAQSATSTTVRESAQRLALLAEQRQEWSHAVAFYESLLRKDRDNLDLRSAYIRCLRRTHIARRHRDPSYQAVLNQLTPSQALDIYHQVLLIVPSVYVDSYRTGLAELFSSGVQEVLYALDDEVFVRQYLNGVVREDLRDLRERLQRLRDRRPGPTTREQARDLVLSVGQMVHDLGLAVRKNFLIAITLEMTAGACNALDEYTSFLTPGSAANEAMGIEVPVGVGMEVINRGGEIVVSRVHPRGPAEEAGLLPEDRLYKINGQPVDGLAPEIIHERLRGEPNSLVELEVQHTGQPMTQQLRLARRHVTVPTVEYRLLADPMAMEVLPTDTIGYLRITGFQSGTLQDVKEALAQLQTQGARAIVLDLRGNGGGLFESAVKIAELFLPEGQLITRGESPIRQFNRPFPVEGGNPLALPLAVLVDGETASAAEVLVGALKDTNRARLMGQPTYGKGLIQCVIPITRPGTTARFATALKITVARFLTPARNPVTRQGILPHDLLEVEGETAVNAARLHHLGVLRTVNLR